MITKAWVVIEKNVVIYKKGKNLFQMSFLKPFGKTAHIRALTEADKFINWIDGDAIFYRGKKERAIKLSGDDLQIDQLFQLLSQTYDYERKKRKRERLKP